MSHFDDMAKWQSAFEARQRWINAEETERALDRSFSLMINKKWRARKRIEQKTAERWLSRCENRELKQILGDSKCQKNSKAL